MPMSLIPRPGRTIILDFPYVYVLNSNGDATITGYTGNDADLVIPASLDGHSVTSIGYRMFSHCSNLTSVTIPESVTSIGEDAFYDCTSLQAVYYSGTQER